MEIEKIEQIIKLFKQYELLNIYVESDNFKLRIEDYKNSFTNVKKVNLADDEDVNINEKYIIKSPLVGNVRILENKAKCKNYAVGDEVKEGEVLCIVEAMKMLNEITCNKNGLITEVLIKDNEFVEYNQPLFIIKESKEEDV
ncbi:acetyl-CoA carboxylase biotin carboxyl carrier protein [Clostridium cavendishii DSM 21758]|uniref:Biotin carboxyl carrier protein of acetyl-CoA carboxylase n=1 Tax=Clostridium cavendishii DSM 21758 TaxID=1121302 RepID=A0A1M6MV66_9CLOT|nr:biotin/lipoyl-containing protein [Clostridium cavendishii]SHJ87183.1 acetyl-CoA carboxylase biotin carboxyl carrier protein [Clostridium cavendishii DSM 21758]